MTVVLNEKSDEYQATFANLGLSGVPIGTQYVTANPKLLSGNGVWCIITLGYLSGQDIKVRWDIQTLKPIQISNIDLQDYIDQRKKFTTDERIDFLIHTLGLNPDMLNRREKLITLARLLPHIENNFNFMELGPKGTGKSHVFQELSPNGVLVSGGDVTSARLFVKIQGNKEILGLVGYWDVVAWDEFEQQKGRAVDAVLIDTMQNYLANKSFNRGKATHEASASMSFVGNTKHTVPYMLKNTHLFESIPTSFIKGAFLDRIHLYNPGWEIRMLKKESFSKGYGLITDYIAAVLHELRNKDLTSLLKDYAKFDPSLSERDHLAIRKTFSGMVKLLYPDGNMTNEEAFELVDFAAESRKRVKDQLYIIDETFKAEPAYFEYTDMKSGRQVYIQTMEQIENNIPLVKKNETNRIPSEPARPTNTVSISHVSETPQTEVTSAGSELQTCVKEIRENQKGISFKKLFADYLKGSRKITITDPFIRLYYQVDNLLEFLNVVKEVTADQSDVKIHLSTQNDEEKIPEMIDIFDEITDDLAASGIEFTYDFDATHDRSIKLDTGWMITLGRGLDIYDKYPKFSTSKFNQEERRCKKCTITYNKEVGDFE